MANAVGRSLSKVDRAYIAGLMDGDGSVMAIIEKHSEKKFGYRVRIALQVTQKNRDHVEWLTGLTGFGFVRSNRHVFDWRAYDQKAILQFLEMIRPYARSKKKQMDLACKILRLKINTFANLYSAAHLADQLSELNVRSKKRRKNYSTLLMEEIPVTTDPKGEARTQ